MDGAGLSQLFRDLLRGTRSLVADVLRREGLEVYVLRRSVVVYAIGVRLSGSRMPSDGISPLSRHRVDAVLVHGITWRGTGASAAAAGH